VVAPVVRFLAANILERIARSQSEPAARPLIAANSAPIHDRSSACDLDLPVVNYCVTSTEAEAAIREAIADAAGACWPVALDTETAPASAEAERLRGLNEQLARLKGERKAAKKAKAPESEIEAFATEEKVLKARIKYVARAGLDPSRASIRLVQLHAGRRVHVIDVFRTGVGVLRALNGVDVVIHNAGFDLGFLEEVEVELGEVHCTAQAARLTLGEWSMSLEDAVKAHLGVELDKSQQVSDWSTPHLTRQQIEYAARDVVMVWRLSRRIFPALGVQRSAYTIQAAVTLAASRMQRRGTLMDVDAHARLMDSLKRERVEKQREYRLACTRMGRPELAVAIPKTPNQIRAAITAMLTSDELALWRRTEKSGALSTARADLRRAAHYPPILPLVRMTQIDKLLSCFGPTLAALVNPVTGRIHSQYRVAGANTGRATCSSPNLQQFPSKKSSAEFRTIFVAGEGMKIVAGDFAQMELRAGGHISRDGAMLDAFRNGVDLHRMTAARMMGKRIEQVTEDERSYAKPINFGALFGERERGLVESAWKDYQLVLTFDEAHEWLIVFTKTYPDFAKWRYTHFESCKAAGCIVIGRDAAMGIGRLFPLSRVPPGGSVYTRSCNMPIQGACADASMLALTAIDQALFDAGIDGGPIAWVHDEIVLEVAAADAVLAKQLLEQAMLEAFEQTFPGAEAMGLLNGLVEANIGDNWAEAKEKPKKK
jgi:DNA polymerase-1